MTTTVQPSLGAAGRFRVDDFHSSIDEDKTMEAIIAIVIFIVVFLILNRVEFGRFD